MAVFFHISLRFVVLYRLLSLVFWSFGLVRCLFRLNISCVCSYEYELIILLVLISVCWVVFRMREQTIWFFNKKLQVNPHYLITLKNSWFFFLNWHFLINSTSFIITWELIIHNISYYSCYLDSLISDNCPLHACFILSEVLPLTPSFCEGVKKSRRRLVGPDHTSQFLGSRLYEFSIP